MKHDEITTRNKQDFWMVRVPVSENQAVVAFPKFGIIGIGFQKEEDWNCNLPIKISAAEIYEHIKHNKGGVIPRERCIEAIKMIQAYLAKIDL